MVLFFNESDFLAIDTCLFVHTSYAVIGFIFDKHIFQQKDVF